MFNIKIDVERALKKYPSLRLLKMKEQYIVQGTFFAKDFKKDIEIETYEVRIFFPPNYPKEFPKVIEISNKIPHDVNRHINILNSNTLCFANPTDELYVCKNGISFLWFLDEILNPHLCREYVREHSGKYPTGERSHETEGIWEGYYEIFKIQDKDFILNELNLILDNIAINRNAQCYCGNNKKFKVCHLKIHNEITKIGKENALQLFEKLKKEYIKI